MPWMPTPGPDGMYSGDGMGYSGGGMYSGHGSWSGQSSWGGGSGGGQSSWDSSSSWEDGRGDRRDMSMMGPFMNLQLFFGYLAQHVASGRLEGYQLPGCQSAAMSANFRRFIKLAMGWEGLTLEDFKAAQKIPGYEKVDPMFVQNLHKVISMVSSGMMRRMPELFDDDSYPRSLEKHMERWATGRMLSPYLPMPEGLLDDAMEAVRNATGNFTLSDWETDRGEQVNRTMKLLNKVATEMLKEENADLRDDISAVARDLHRVVIFGGPGGATGKPGDAPSLTDACRRMVAMSLKEDQGMDSMGNAPMLVKRDGDIYSVSRSPFTNEYLWKKAVACECNSGPQRYY